MRDWLVIKVNYGRYSAYLIADLDQKELALADTDPSPTDSSPTDPSPTDSSPTDSSPTDIDAQEYWRRNLSLMIKLGIIWFVVSYGCGILFVDTLNHIKIGGYKLGFWFAQQGSIYTFIALIFYYTKAMERLDREFGVEESD